MGEDATVRRRLAHALRALFALSFVPYALPVARRPALYRDGRSSEEMARARRRRTWSQFLGGDVHRAPGFENVGEDAEGLLKGPPCCDAPTDRNAKPPPPASAANPSSAGRSTERIHRRATW